MTNPFKLTSNKVLAFIVCMVLSFCFVYTVSAQGTIVNADVSSSQPVVGSTLTVTLVISNVQNLFGLDASLQWNPSVLSLSNVALNIGGSQSNGVLHGTVNQDFNNINSGDIYVNETKASGSYDLVAQSFGQNTQSYTGSGTIATLTFNVVGSGSAGLSLTTDLADKAAPGQNANNIDHQDTASSVTAVASESSSTPTVPEFPSTIIIVLFITLAVAVTIFAAKTSNKNKITARHTTLTCE